MFSIKNLAYICGYVHACMFMNMLTLHNYAYVKPNLSASVIHMVPQITNWLFLPCTVFICID